MKGNLIISGTAGKYKPSLIKPQAQLKQAKVIATNYACQLSLIMTYKHVTFYT